MWSALRARSPSTGALALGSAIVLLTLIAVVAAPIASASVGDSPAPTALTVTLVLDKASYLSGDNATATAIVYRTPAPTNYTYAWRVENFFGGLLASLSNGTSTSTYPIPLTFEGIIRFRVTVTDTQGGTAAAARTANVAFGYVALTLDRSEYNPGDRITASFSLVSHAITNPTWDYVVTDAQGTSVLVGNTSAGFFVFGVPNPSSRAYTFTVTASASGGSANAVLTIAQAGGFVLSLTTDQASYNPGDTVHVHLTVTARGTSTLPSQFRFTVSLLGTAGATAISTSPQADLSLVVPAGTGPGNLLLFAFEANTGASLYQTIQVGPSSGTFWSGAIGGVPIYAALLGALFVLLLIAVLALWVRTGGGFLKPRGPPGPPAPPAEGPTRAPAATPMTVTCRHCGKPIDLSTSKRPIEVMCPSCGETQLVT